MCAEIHFGAASRDLSADNDAGERSTFLRDTDLASGMYAGKGLRQSSNDVLMVAPTAFGFNDQAAQDNHFMHAGSGGGSAAPQDTPRVTQTVLREFAKLHHQLTEVGGLWEISAVVLMLMLRTVKVLSVYQNG